MFGDRNIRRMIERLPNVYLDVRDDDGWFKSRFPEGVDELYYRFPGVLTDIERLKSLYELFAEVLNHLCHIGSAYENDPRIAL
jgi:hypothetical protein